MSVQSIVLRQLKETYPQAKLKEISEKTGIQITRVFRLLNGAEMKVSEWEKIKTLTDINNGIEDFLATAKECALSLSPQRRQAFHSSMQQALKILELNSTSQMNYSGVCHGL